MLVNFQILLSLMTGAHLAIISTVLVANGPLLTQLVLSLLIHWQNAAILSPFCLVIKLAPEMLMTSAHFAIISTILVKNGPILTQLVFNMLIQSQNAAILSPFCRKTTLPPEMRMTSVHFAIISTLLVSSGPVRTQLVILMLIP